MKKFDSYMNTYHFRYNLAHGRHEYYAVCMFVSKLMVLSLIHEVFLPTSVRVIEKKNWLTYFQRSALLYN